MLSEGSTRGQTGGQAKENLFLSAFPNAHLWELPGEPEPQTPFAVSPDYLHLGPHPPSLSPLLLCGHVPAWTFHLQRKKTKPACCSVFVLGAPVPRRASWSPRPGIALSLQASQPACPARPSELLVFIKILLHAQSRTVCGSWMRWCGGTWGEQGLRLIRPSVYLACLSRAGENGSP